MTHPKTPVSLPPHPRFAITSPPPFVIGEQSNASDGAQCLSLDGAMDKRLPSIQEYVRQLIADIENATKEKEDLQMQVKLMLLTKFISCTVVYKFFSHH